MAKLIEYDVSNVEESSGGTGVKVRPGVRVCRIMKVTQRTEKRDGTPANDLEVALSFGDEYDWVFTYIGLDPSSDWKLAEFIRAINLPPKGKINPDKLSKDKPLLRAKVNPGEYNNDYRPEIGRLMKPQDGDELGDSVSQAAAAEADEPTDDAAADEPTTSGGGEPTYKEGFVPSREADPEVGSYDDWNEDDLLAECEDRGVTLPGGRGSKKDKAIAALRAEDAEVAGSGDDTGDDSGDTTATAEDDDYDTWDLEALIKEYNERNFDDSVPSFKGRNGAERTKAAIITAIREDDVANPFEG